MSPPKKYLSGGKIRSYWVSRENIEKLQALAEKTGDSLSQIVNKAIQRLTEADQ